jgi:hypothetical protein
VARNLALLGTHALYVAYPFFWDRRISSIAHLLVTCKAHQVKACRHKFLERCINYLDHVKRYIWEGGNDMLSKYWGLMDWTLLRERAISVYLRGGLIRLELMLQHCKGWFDLYQLGFGHFRLVTPGFTAQLYNNRTIHTGSSTVVVFCPWARDVRGQLCHGVTFSW